MKPTLEQIKTDESVWPDGATHYMPESEYCCAVYYKKEGERLLFKIPEVNDSWEVDRLWLPADAIPRPTKAFVPEVGVECEYYTGDEFLVGEVLKVDERGAFPIYAIMNTKTRILYWTADIRHIKSEREKFIEAVCKLSEGYGGLYCEKFASELYDSGKFKLVEPTK